MQAKKKYTLLDGEFIKHKALLGKVSCMDDVLRRLFDMVLYKKTSQYDIEKNKIYYLYAKDLTIPFNKGESEIYKEFINLKDTLCTYIEVNLGNQKTVTTAVVEKVILDASTYSIGIKFVEDIEDYITGTFDKGAFSTVNIKASALPSARRHTCAELIYALKYLLNYRRNDFFDISVEQLRKCLNMENEYKNFNDFRRFVLDKCIEDLGGMGLRLEYSTKRIGRKVGVIRFAKEGSAWKYIDKESFRIVDLIEGKIL